MGGKKRRWYEEQKILAIGGSLPKTHKMPLNHAREHHQNRVKKAVKQREKDKQLGIQTTVSNFRTRTNAINENKKKKARNKERFRGLTNYNGVGKDLRGEFALSKDLVRKYK